MTLNGLKTFLCDAGAAMAILDSRGLLKWLPDRGYLKLLYRLKFKKKLDLRNPKTFNEKLQWLKLYDRKPEYTRMVDKYEAKQYVAERIGAEYVVPCYGVWDSLDEIPFDKLPKQFVLKTTHDCGGVVICQDKDLLDKVAAKKKLEKHLKRNYYYGNREWPYKNVKPRIIAEQYLEDRKTQELRDYKFFCFDGDVKALFVATDRYSEQEETKFDFFDMEYQHLDIRNGHPNAEVPPEKPQAFEEMRTLAEKLSKGIPQIRVDFYEVNGKIYFGELTFFHWSGMVPFEPEQWNEVLGSWIKLPNRRMEQ